MKNTRKITPAETQWFTDFVRSLPGKYTLYLGDDYLAATPKGCTCVVLSNADRSVPFITTGVQVIVWGDDLIAECYDDEFADPTLSLTSKHLHELKPVLMALVEQKGPDEDYFGL